MNWNYNGLPDTNRDVLIAALTNNGKVYYGTSTRNFRGTRMVIPEEWMLLAWADFPRIEGEVNGTPLKSMSYDGSQKYDDGVPYPEDYTEHITDEDIAQPDESNVRGIMNMDGTIERFNGEY